MNIRSLLSVIAIFLIFSTAYASESLNKLKETPQQEGGRGRKKKQPKGKRQKVRSAPSRRSLEVPETLPEIPSETNTELEENQ